MRSTSLLDFSYSLSGHNVYLGRFDSIPKKIVDHIINGFELMAGSNKIMRENGIGYWSYNVFYVV